MVFEPLLEDDHGGAGSDIEGQGVPQLLGSVEKEVFAVTRLGWRCSNMLLCGSSCLASMDWTGGCRDGRMEEESGFGQAEHFDQVIDPELGTDVQNSCLLAKSLSTGRLGSEEPDEVILSDLQFVQQVGLVGVPCCRAIGEVRQH